MSSQDARYLNWVRTQDCMACGGPGPCEAHHALCGTTYSPDEGRPAKAIEGARKGKSQKSHDHFAFALHLRCHAQFHRGTGMFAGWSPAERDDWERDRVAKSRQRYAMVSPEPIASPTPAGVGKRKRLGAGWTVATIRDWCRKEARTRPALAAAALDELADLIETDTL